jgi:hypothetical protein
VYNNSQWETDLLLTPNEDGKTWTLKQELVYETDIGYKIVVPAGFVTDLASVPRLLWLLWPPFGKYTRAAVIHDWLYDLHRKGGKHYSRCYADAVLIESMRDCTVRERDIACIWLGVRLGGWWAWRPKKGAV